MGAAASVPLPESGDAEALGGAIHLKQLPGAMENAVYVHERWPCIVDPDGQAARFLRYQRGSLLTAMNPAHMEAAYLRRSLIGALRYGTTMAIVFESLDTVDLESFFEENMFPPAVVSRSEVFKQEFWEPLLRPDEGDPVPHEFLPMDQFCFCIITKTASVPEDLSKIFHVIRLQGETPDAGAGGAGGGGDALEDLLGAKEIVRNSKDLVEYGFDGELDEIITLFEKGFHIESEDGRGHTALSEAACQGHNNVIEWLLEKGADPNKANDQGRTPLYRAAYNGHTATIELLLQKGGDPGVKTKGLEGPYDVAKDDATRAVFDAWAADNGEEKTTRLVEERAKEMKRKLEERLTTAAEREFFARKQIQEELVQLTIAGDTEGLKSRLLELAEEAEDANTKRPRGSANSRDERGCTLLGLAAQYGHKDIVELLLTHHKTCDEGNIFLEAGQDSMECITFRAGVNAKDQKGWTPVQLAVFHEQVPCLRLVLEHGANPRIKNSYNKSAFDLAKDELDAAMNVVKSHAEVRTVLEDWEREQGGQSMFGTGAGANGEAGEDMANVPKEGTATMLAAEVAKEGVPAAEPKKKKGKGKKGAKGAKGKKKKKS